MAELHAHRIARIEHAELRSHYPRTIGKNSHLDSHGSGPATPIALIHTDQGAVGWGLTTASTPSSGIIGRRVGELFDPAQGVIVEAALPLDFALHDLAGVILNQPVYRMLGATAAQAVPCYDGAIYMDDLDPEDAPRGIDIVLEHCAHDYALGYRAFKLKIGRGYRWMDGENGLRRDIEVTRAVRERYPDCDILVDANDGYSGEGFLLYLDGVVDCRLFWIEEPFRETREDLLRLRRYLDKKSPETLIADGELRPDIPLLLDLAREKLLDVLLMDIVGLGLTPWRRLMPTLKEMGIQASPHAWGVPLKTLYTAQLAAGLGNVVTVEGVPGTAAAIDCTGYRLEEGLLYVPDAPGWGIGAPASPSR
jgi:L-alanine-DL-glutamate epimerase-like enolase superfamily enzyme